MVSFEHHKMKREFNSDGATCPFGPLNQPGFIRYSGYQPNISLYMPPSVEGQALLSGNKTKARQKTSTSQFLRSRLQGRYVLRQSRSHSRLTFETQTVCRNLISCDIELNRA